MDNKTQEKLNNDFIDYFGMTLDEFSELDIDTQEILIMKVKKLRKKLLNKEKNTIKRRIAQIFSNILVIPNEENKIKRK